MLFLADRTIALPKISSLRVQNMFCDSLKESEKDKKKNGSLFTAPYLISYYFI